MGINKLLLQFQKCREVERKDNYNKLNGLLQDKKEYNIQPLKDVLDLLSTDLEKNNNLYSIEIWECMMSLLTHGNEHINCGESVNKAFVPNLVSIGLILLKRIVCTKNANNSNNLKIQLDVLEKYPDDILMIIANEHKNIFLLFQNRCFNNTVGYTKLDHKICGVICQFLKKYPSDSKQTFVKHGLAEWFSKVLPFTLKLMEENYSLCNDLIQLLELLVEELIHIDYSNDENWHIVLDKICTPTEYIGILKKSMQNGSDNWHKLWCIFVKLLKNEITSHKDKKNNGPINYMLSVVEDAFKSGIDNRCRAFHCWKVLIDSFSTETSESLIMKRVKLLLIPLKANNAKFELVALAKFNAWWHFIKKFQSKIVSNQLFCELILIPYLHFCFGNVNHKSNQVVFTPGLYFKEVQKLCLNSFMEMFCHGDDNCLPDDFPKLESRIFNISILINNLNDVTYSLKGATVLLSKSDKSLVVVTKQISCLWQSCIEVLAALPDNNVRKDLLTELLKVLSQLQDNEDIRSKPDIIFDTLLSFFENQKIANLLKVKRHENVATSLLVHILQLILKPHYYKCFIRNEDDASNNACKPLMKSTLTFVETPGEFIEWILQSLPVNDNTITVWEALADVICESKFCITYDTISYVVKWPLTSTDWLPECTRTFDIWQKLYVYSKPNANLKINNDILEVVNSNTKKLTSLFTCYVLTSTSLTALLTNENIVALKQYISLLTNYLSAIEKESRYKEIKSEFSKLVYIFVSLMNKFKTFAHLINQSDLIIALNNLMQILLKAYRDTNYDTEVRNEISSQMRQLLESFSEFIKQGSELQNANIIVETIISCSKLEKPFQQNIVAKVLKQLLPYTHVSVCSELITNANELDTPLMKEVVQNETPEKSKTVFPTPLKQKGSSSKKNKINIVKKVVENGEEFVDVQTNWKFNPKKLTEHQKEKLQSKNQDIPALYQDLSQSQDEFKLKPWMPGSKSDSQDLSSSNSRSLAASRDNDMEAILKNVTNPTIVPNILYNMLSEKSKKDCDEVVNQTESKSRNYEQIETFNKIVLPSPKQSNAENAMSPGNKITKSPRLGLKDRINQNMKRLMDKVVLKNDYLDKSMSPNFERPLRTKRTPKKFDVNFQITPLKRRRNSVIDKSENDYPINENVNIVKDDCNVIDEFKPDNQINTNAIDTIVKDDTNDESQREEMIANETNLPSFQDKECNHNATIILESDASDDNIEQTIETQQNLECRMVEPQPDKVESSSKDNTPAIESKQSKPVTKKTPRKSRLEKELAIDMVEGHPFLNGSKDNKSNADSIKSTRRTKLVDKLNTVKPEESTSKSLKINTSSTENVNENDIPMQNENSVQEAECNPNIEDVLTQSEDFIESSQDSAISAISIKPSRQSLKKQKNDCVSKKEEVSVNKELKIVLRQFDSQELSNSDTASMDTNSLVSTPESDVIVIADDDDDEPTIELNSQDVNGKTDTQTTADADTESMDPSFSILTNAKSERGGDNSTLRKEVMEIGSETLEIANADTQPINNDIISTADNVITASDILFGQKSNESTKEFDTQDTANDDTELIDSSTLKENTDKVNKTQNTSKLNVESENIIKLNDDIESSNLSHSALSSPFKDDAQRNSDFLNNTMDISPIKQSNPERENNTPSPEKDEYVVVHLSSPVKSNGEPIENDSPEIFTNEKISPDKTNQSPPRKVTPVQNSSPSIKKARVRITSRAAQMLSLCQPDKLESMDIDVEGIEEPKKPTATPARRNLRMFYNAVSDNSENTDESEHSEHFLKFKRTLPSADSSPSVPILKRKFSDIQDNDITMSPANKRKRVSFHDPPVSTTISVQKYLEPFGTRSPQSSLNKRQERRNNLKSQKKLENVFKMSSPLSKSATENDSQISLSDDMSSLDQTPVVEVINNGDLNNTDPICPELVACTDSIEIIAKDLSSSSMKATFLKEIEGQIVTIGDLAKLTEAEVNRLCIKAPKVACVKSVLANYLDNESELIVVDIDNSVEENIVIEHKNDPLMESPEKSTNETQTVQIEIRDIEMQTDNKVVTEESIQTDESSFMSTEDIIKASSKERPDYVEEVSKLFHTELKEKLIDKMSLEDILDLLKDKVSSDTDRNLVLDKVIVNNGQLNEYLIRKLKPNDLVQFSILLLQNVHSKIL